MAVRQRAGVPGVGLTGDAPGAVSQALPHRVSVTRFCSYKTGSRFCFCFCFETGFCSITSFTLLSTVLMDR